MKTKTKTKAKAKVKTKTKVREFGGAVGVAVGVAWLSQKRSLNESENEEKKEKEENKKWWSPFCSSQKSEETSFTSQSSFSKTTTPSSGTIASFSKNLTQTSLDKDDHNEEAKVSFFVKVGKNKKFEYFHFDE